MDGPMDRGNTLCPFHHSSNGGGIKIIPECVCSNFEWPLKIMGKVDFINVCWCILSPVTYITHAFFFINCKTYHYTKKFLEHGKS